MKLKKEDFLQHIITAHEPMLMKYMSKELFEEEKTPVAPQPVGYNLDRIQAVRNEAGHRSRIGDNGKYYCGNRLNTDCSCCDGFCGTTNGCNCVACMKLDCAARMLPDHYLVNRAGRTCRRGTTGHVYCGGKTLVGVRGCDGWCGPTDGPQCKDCKILEVQWSTRYGSIVGSN